jgi:hypothetical protein
MLRLGGQTCPANVFVTRQENRICPNFLERLIGRYFQRLALHQLTQYIPLDSMEFLGHLAQGWKILHGGGSQMPFIHLA